MSSQPSRQPLHVKKEFRIKKETPDDEIKEYAETAMNEFLGWYGYDKVDSRDTQHLNLHHFARRHSATDDDSSDDARSCSPPRKDNPACNSPPSEGSSTSTRGCATCCWCNKSATQKSFSLKTPGGLKLFCSELCFTQCRRANFKRNKTCDWCRHIRHTVNYVDFQDGEHQLQFCSDKCLNQYKMNIFCKETEAHLQLHPHLAEGSTSVAGGGSLITPDLWMRDCRSATPPSASPSPPPEPPRDRKEEPPRERKKVPRRKRSKSPLKTAHSFPPPPLLPLNGLPHFLPPPRPPFLGFFPNTFSADSSMRLSRLPPGLKPHLVPPLPAPPMLPPPNRPNFPSPPKSLLPPVTVLIPYPIPIPIPLPIPIPIPIPLDASKLPFYTKDEKCSVDTEGEKNEKDKDAVNVESSKTKVTSAEKPQSDSPARNAPRPLRKRRRLNDLPKEPEAGSKRKTVPA